MIKQTADIIKQALSLENPDTAIILGSGLNGFATTLERAKSIAYKDIPDFPYQGIKAN